MRDDIYGMQQTLKVIRSELDRQEHYLEEHPERYRRVVEKKQRERGFVQ
jgi:hypothetical protein